MIIIYIMKEGVILKVLIVDDSVDLCSAIKKNLMNNNYEVDCAYDGKKGLRKALENNYDIILLDIMMPQMNGFKVLEELRKQQRAVPIILLTAKNDVSDKIAGLELGADDYIQKPFNIDELMARIRAVARRSNMNDYDSNIIKYADIILNKADQHIYTGELNSSLSAEECTLLQYLIKNSSVIIPCEKIIDVCFNSNADTQLIETLINRLKYKLLMIHSKVQIIFIKKVGYKLCS